MRPVLPNFILSRRWHEALGPNGGTVYVRCSYRRDPDNHMKMLRTLDIADVNLPDEDRGKGYFTEFLATIEPEARRGHGIEALYIENVLNERLAAFFRKREGYRPAVEAAPDPRCPSFIFTGDWVYNLIEIET